MTLNETMAALADCEHESLFSRFGDDGRYGVSERNSSYPRHMDYAELSKISNTAEIGNVSFYFCPPFIKAKVQGVTAMKYKIDSGGMEWLLYSPVLESRVTEAANIFYKRIVAWKQENAEAAAARLAGDVAFERAFEARWGVAHPRTKPKSAIPSNHFADEDEPVDGSTGLDHPGGYGTSTPPYRPPWLLVAKLTLSILAVLAGLALLALMILTAVTEAIK